MLSTLLSILFVEHAHFSPPSSDGVRKSLVRPELIAGFQVGLCRGDASEMCKRGAQGEELCS